jgi:hypothetical protein
MKKTILIALVLLAAILLMAATPAPLQKLSGTLRFDRANICGLPDYVALPVMDNVYLKGLVFPSTGQFQGCHIDALGLYRISPSSSQCKVFDVRSVSITCPYADTDPASTIR